MKKLTWASDDNVNVTGVACASARLACRIADAVSGGIFAELSVKKL